MSLIWKPYVTMPHVLKAESCLVRVAEDGEIRPCLWRIVGDDGEFLVYVVAPLSDFLPPCGCDPEFLTLDEAKAWCQEHEDAFAAKGWLAFAEQLAGLAMVDRFSGLQTSAKIIEDRVAAKRAALKKE